MCHTEPLQVRLEAHPSKVLTCAVVGNQRLVFAGHVVPERLLEVSVGLSVASLYHKFCGENVRQLCSKAISAACHLHLFVVVVA